MSAGVSDQRMKGQGNQVSNVPKDHIESGDDFESWRHQPGRHAPYVPISTTADPFSAGGQFQYPPFGVGDGTWSSNNENLAVIGYTAHDNYGVDGMFGPSFAQPSSYNYFPANGDYNTWGSQQVNPTSTQATKGLHYDDYYRDQSVYPPVHDGLKTVEQGMQGLGLDVGSSLQQSQDKDLSNNSHSSNPNNSNIGKSEPTKENVPKKMTWASIASQPAKPQVNTTTSTVKKKGPGMPPPPMVPGKHNMDIGTWDSPKNGPSMLVPPPPPPVIIAPSPIAPTPVAHTNKSNNTGPIPQPVVQTPINQQQHQQVNMQQNHHPQQQHPLHHQNHHQQPQQQQHHHPNSVRGSQINSAAQGNNRPSWGGPGPNNNQNNNNINNNSVKQHQQSQHGHQESMTPHTQQQQRINIHQGQPNQSLIGPTNYQGPPPTQTPLTQNNVKLSPAPGSNSPGAVVNPNNPVLEQLRDKNNYNPSEMDLERANLARFFVIKSYSEDDIHRSIKYEIWCSTEYGNKRLDEAYKEREKEGGLIYLFFSVNGSMHFCGMAQMITCVDYNSNSNVWSQDKWKGTFKVKWVYVKDVPNTQLRHIRLENNENKSVTNSRDAQEVPNAQGQQVLHIIHAYENTTSIFDDFIHYEKRQLEEDCRKGPGPQSPGLDIPSHHSGHNNKHGGGRYDKEHGHSSYNDKSSHHSNDRGERGGYDKNHHHSGSGERGGYDKHSNYGGKGYGFDKHQQYNHSDRGCRGGGYHGSDNRRGGDDHHRSGMYDRGPKEHHDGGFHRDNNDYNNRNDRAGGDRGGDRDYRDNRREDRGGSSGGGAYNRDRDLHHDGNIGGYGRSGGSRPGGNRGDHHHRDRGDLHSGGGSRGSRGRGHRN